MMMAETAKGKATMKDLGALMTGSHGAG